MRRRAGVEVIVTLHPFAERHSRQDAPTQSPVSRQGIILPIVVIAAALVVYIAGAATVALALLLAGLERMIALVILAVTCPSYAKFGGMVSVGPRSKL